MTAIETPPQKSKKRVRGDAMQRFAKSCSRVMRDNGDELAAALFRRAAEDSTPAAHLLLKIIEKQPLRRSHKKHNASVKRALIASLANLQWNPNQPQTAPEPDRETAKAMALKR